MTRLKISGFKEVAYELRKGFRQAEDAINTAIDEHGPFRDFDELNSYIKNNLI